MLTRWTHFRFLCSTVVFTFFQHALCTFCPPPEYIPNAHYHLVRLALLPNAQAQLAKDTLLNPISFHTHALYRRMTTHLRLLLLSPRSPPSPPLIGSAQIWCLWLADNFFYCYNHCFMSVSLYSSFQHGYQTHPWPIYQPCSNTNHLWWFLEVVWRMTAFESQCPPYRLFWFFEVVSSMSGVMFQRLYCTH